MTRKEKLKAIKLKYVLIARKQKSLIKKEALYIVELLEDLIKYNLSPSTTIDFLKCKKSKIDKKYVPVLELYTNVIKELERFH